MLRQLLNGKGNMILLHTLFFLTSGGCIGNSSQVDSGGRVRFHVLAQGRAAAARSWPCAFARVFTYQKCIYISIYIYIKSITLFLNIAHIEKNRREKKHAKNWNRHAKEEEKT